MEPTIFECPRCGRLWVGFPPGPHKEHAFSGYVWNTLRGDRPHAPFLRLDPEEGTAIVSGFAICHGIPESVQKKAAMVAYLLGGPPAAEACVDFALRDAIWLMEVEQCERQYRRDQETGR